MIIIKDDKEAQQYKFFGSPQININNKDIDPKAENMKNYHLSGCRMYSYKDRMYEHPPKEMIEEIFDKHK